MEKMTRSELQKLQILNDLEVVTDKQLAGYVIAATQDIEKSTTAEDTKRTVEKEVSSFRPIEVYDDVEGHIEKSIVFIRPAQIAWTDKENGKGVFKDTPLNRELYRVGDDIQKGKAAVPGEVRTWGGKKYKKQPNGKWVEIGEYGMTKKQHQSKSEEFLGWSKSKEAKKDENKKRDYMIAAGLHQGHADKLSDKEYDDDEVGLGDDIQKGKAAVAGEIRTWGDKKYKKQPNGKWVEVSEHGMSSNEHGLKAQYLKEEANKKTDKGKSTKDSIKYDEEANKHSDIAGKLSDKEYDEDELEGVSGKTKELDAEIDLKNQKLYIDGKSVELWLGDDISNLTDYFKNGKITNPKLVVKNLRKIANIREEYGGIKRPKDLRDVANFIESFITDKKKEGDEFKSKGSSDKNVSLNKEESLKKLDEFDINMIYENHGDDPRFEEFSIKQDKILSKYLKKEPADYVVTGGGSSTEEEMFDELKSNPEKFNEMVGKLERLNKRYGFSIRKK